MRLYCVGRYRSGFGEFNPGQDVDVSDEVGELLLRDSPGSFTRTNPEASDPNPEPTATGLMAPDRRARGGQIR